MKHPASFFGALEKTRCGKKEDLARCFRRKIETKERKIRTLTNSADDRNTSLLRFDAARESRSIEEDLGWVLLTDSFSQVASMKRYETYRKSINYKVKGHWPFEITRNSSVRGDCLNLQYWSNQLLIAS